MNTVSTPPWNQFDLCFCSGKESTGEILSVNYLFYGSQEYHTQQSVQLNRIFYESFLSFWAAWGNVCVSVCQGEQQQPFWYTGPQKTPESRVLCHQHADENKVGLNLGPDMASRPLHALSQTQILINHTSNKENFNTIRTMSVLAVSHSSSTYSFPMWFTFVLAIPCYKKRFH